MPFRLKPTPKQLIIIAITVTIAACGVGGGGGGGGGSGDESDNYPGYTDFQVENDSLDSGDLTNVTLTVHDVNKDGVILKFHYPKSLKYQSHSAQMYSGDDETWGQTTPYTEASTDSGRYLVFFLSRPPRTKRIE